MNRSSCPIQDLRKVELLSRPQAQLTHFRWLSVRVMPWADTLKCTMVDKGGGSWTRVILRAFWTAWRPVRDSNSTEFRYHTLQAIKQQRKQLIKTVGQGPRTALASMTSAPAFMTLDPKYINTGPWGYSGSQCRESKETTGAKKTCPCRHTHPDEILSLCITTIRHLRWARNTMWILVR